MHCRAGCPALIEISSHVELHERTESREADVTIGADGFSYTRPEAAGQHRQDFKLGAQV